jgi:hypothetical protein
MSADNLVSFLFGVIVGFISFSLHPNLNPVIRFTSFIKTRWVEIKEHIDQEMDKPTDPHSPDSRRFDK